MTETCACTTGELLLVLLPFYNLPTLFFFEVNRERPELISRKPWCGWLDVISKRMEMFILISSPRSGVE
jgi:hypothetical protein